MGQILRRPTKWILVALMAIGGLAALLGTASQAIWTDTDPVGGRGKVVMVRKSRRNAQWILVALMAVGLLAALVGTASRAIWTSSVDVGANDFTTGSVTIGTTPATDALNLTLAKPGDTTGPVAILVQNTGSLNFIYSVSAASAPATALDTEMDLEVRLNDATVGGDATPATPCDEFDGTRLHLAGGPGDLVPAGGKIIGDSAVGNQGTPGGGDRTLNSGSTENLCFKVTLPTNAPNTAQSLTTVVTFTFWSEQL